MFKEGCYPVQEIKVIVERKLGRDTLVHECRNGEWLIHRSNEDEPASPLFLESKTAIAGQ